VCGIWRWKCAHNVQWNEGVNGYKGTTSQHIVLCKACYQALQNGARVKLHRGSAQHESIDAVVFTNPEMYIDNAWVSV